MSEIIISRLSSPCTSELEELSDIFFESSTKKELKDLSEKEAFKWKYLGFYLKTYPEFVLVAKKNERVLGYCLGSPVTDDPELLKIQPHLEKFIQFLHIYPAHLHINLHADSRGHGIGSLLVKEYLKLLKIQGISGCHIMTGPDSLNRSFYSRLGFDHEVTLAFKGSNILMMGMRF